MIDMCLLQQKGKSFYVITCVNNPKVRELALSQESQPGTHSTPNEIAKQIPGCSSSSVQRIIKLDLRLKPLKPVKVQRLTAKNEVQRLACAKRLLRNLTAAKLRKTFFSDEKIFKVIQVYNSQNDRFYVPEDTAKCDVDIRRLIREKTAFPVQFMVSAAVSKLGKTNMVFIPKGLRMDSQEYQDKVLDKLVPDMRRLSGNDYIFQQDGARCHTSASTLSYLDQSVREYLAPEDWPPNSCDLNPLDYFIWSRLESAVYRVKITSIEQLKKRVRKCWRELDQREVDRAIDGFRKRLKAVVAENGGHIIKFKL